VRPGAAPRARRGRRVLGPTPRYAVMPRWTLADRVEGAPAAVEKPAYAAPSAAVVRAAMFATVLLLSLTALVYVVRYVLLVINRTVLLNSLLAIAADWLGVLASLAAIASVITSGVLLIRWLIARRAEPRRRGGPRPNGAPAG